MSIEANCRIVEESLDQLKAHGRIPIRFEVRQIIAVEGENPATAILRATPVTQPWIKDYDTIKGEGPTRWARRWDLSHWGLLAAYVGDQHVGGCVLAHQTNGVNQLEGRDDLVALWDLRIHPDHRRQGIGHRLFAAAVQWARGKLAREMKIETQNINVPACRFYERQGCHLCSINRSAYAEFPDEVELIWSLRL